MRTRAIAATFVAAGLVAAACGSDDDSDSASTDAPAETEAPAATEAPAETEAPADTEAPVETEAPAAEVPDDWPDSVVFGFVPSQEQESLQDDIQPFIDVLEAGLGIDVEGVVTTDYTGLVTAMGTGEADLGAFGPFSYVLGKDEFGNMEALIQSIRFGSATYHGQWMTNDPSVCNEPPVPGTALENQDGEIVQVDALEAVALQVGVAFGDDGPELTDTTEDGTPVSPGLSCIGEITAVEGQEVAFVSESSTSGYLFPALELVNAGIDPQEDITPIFAGSHDAAVTAVYNGDATFGLSFDDARRNIREENPDVGEEVIVFSITREIPNDVVAVRSELPDSLKEAIFTSVEEFLATEEGEEIFDEIYGWTDIRRAEESDFDIVREAATELGITEAPE